MKTKIIILGLVMSVFFALLAYIPFGFDNLSIPPLNSRIVLYFFLINLGLFFTYFVTYRLLIKAINQKQILKTIVIFAVIFSIILVLIPPISSADVFNYVFRARVATIYGENPYLMATENFKSDLYYYFAPKEWNYLTMQYGPLWTSVSVGFSYLAKDSFFWNQFLYKLFALIIFLGSIYFVWEILSIINPDYRTKGLLLYAWNPLILFEAVNNAHNDMFMIFLVIVAVYLFLRKKYLFSLFLLLLSVLVKYITILVFPVFLFFIFKEITDQKERIKFLIKAGVFLLAAVFLFYLPYWEGLQIFKGLFNQSDIKTFMTLSLFPSFIFSFIILLKDFITGWDFDQIMQLVSISGVILFVAIYLWQLKIIQKKKDDFIYRSFVVLFIYILYASVFLRPWYFLWFLPLAIIVDKKYFPHFVFLLTAVGLFSYTVVIISILFILLFILILFLSFLAKGRYFSPFLGFR